MNELATVESNVSTFEKRIQDNMKLIRNQVAPSATPQEFELFIYQCKHHQLDPLTKQIYFMKNKGRVTTITSIDGYRSIAHRTGKYAGKDPVKWTYDEKGKLVCADVTVYKFVEGHKCAFTEFAFYDEYKSGTPTWQKMPKVMLAKVAEAKALRSAFPSELGSLYTQDEMDQAGAAPSSASSSQGEDLSYLNDDKPIEAEVVEEKPKESRKKSVYQGTDQDKQRLAKALKEQGVIKDQWKEAHELMIGQEWNYLFQLIDELKGQEPINEGKQES